MMDPRQPRKPVTMTMAPTPMTMLAADRAGREGEKVAKLPWETESQMPTPSSPQPHSCKTEEEKGGEAEQTDDKNGPKWHKMAQKWHQNGAARISGALLNPKSV